ncbi:MAG: hypothetical protein QNL04_02155 [SAR324 cluster bacterium]|nr:hypothetical protein [SAR324 cluster bacterium]
MKSTSFNWPTLTQANQIAKNLILASILIGVTTTAQAGCWSSAEKGEVDMFSEMENKMVVSVRDAVSCSPVDNASVELFGKTFITNELGEIQFPAEVIGDLTDKKDMIKIQKKEYMTFIQSVDVVLGSLKQKRFLVTKNIPVDSVRFVLQWGKKPNDLDLHLQSSRFHISYRNKRSIANFGKLDRDEKRGTGPETITLYKIQRSENYRLTIHNYSGSPSLNDEVYVSVYANGKLDKVIHLVPSKKRYAEVLTISNKKIHYETKFKNMIYPN